MCVTSMVDEHYYDKWRPYVPAPYVPFIPQPQNPPLLPDDFAAKLAQILSPKEPAVTAEEVAEFRRLLERAREYDKRNHEPFCEMESKRQALLLIAKALGIDISFIETPQPRPDAVLNDYDPR